MWGTSPAYSPDLDLVFVSTGQTTFSRDGVSSPEYEGSLTMRRFTSLKIRPKSILRKSIQRGNTRG
jgi:hypothetical protein